MQAQTPSTPTQTQTETLPPRPTPPSFTTRISMRTHLGHKYTLATHALPLSARDLQYTHLCPARSPETQSSAPWKFPPTATSHRYAVLAHRYPFLSSTTRMSSQIQTPSTSEARQHLRAHTHRHVLRRPTRGQEPRARPFAPPPSAGALERRVCADGQLIYSSWVLKGVCVCEKARENTRGVRRAKRRGKEGRKSSVTHFQPNNGTSWPLQSGGGARLSSQAQPGAGAVK